VNNVIAGITKRIEALVIGQDEDDIGPVGSALLHLINRLILIARGDQENEGKHSHRSHIMNSII
jgi:hypothetical protein